MRKSLVMAALLLGSSFSSQAMQKEESIREKLSEQDRLGLCYFINIIKLANQNPQYSNGSFQSTFINERVQKIEKILNDNDIAHPKNKTYGWLEDLTKEEKFIRDCDQTEDLRGRIMKINVCHSEMRRIRLIIDNCSLSAKTDEKLWALAEFINEIFGDEKLTELKKLIKGKFRAYGYNEVAVEKIEDNIGVSCDVMGVPEVIIPIVKFANLIEQLALVAPVKYLKKKPKEIIFTFDDDWNCEIEIIK